MDLVLRNLRLSEGETTVLTDLGIAGGAHRRHGTGSRRRGRGTGSRRPARLMRHSDYGIAAGHPAGLVVLDCASAEAAVQTLATPLMGFKNGWRTFTRRPAQLHRP